MGKRSNRAGPADKPRVTITDLVDKATLQALQDRFSDKYDVPSGILDEKANPITFERRHSGYCKEIRKTRVGYEMCRAADRHVIEKVRRSGRSACDRCPHGKLLDCAFPLYAGKELVGYFFIGQTKELGKDGDGKFISESLREVIQESRQGKSKTPITEGRLRKLYKAIPTRTPEQIDDLIQVAGEFARDLSSVLSKVREWRRPGQVRQFVAKLALVGDLDALYDACVREIPKLMGTHNCSILTVVYGKRGAKPRLVLQRTSFRQSKRDEGTVYYREGQGLTGWVWENKRALRLDDIKDEAELAQYKDLKHEGVVHDSSHHQEWLGVPLIGSPQKEVLGIIRVPEKKHSGPGGGGGFSFEDEVLLTSIGQYVARRIEELRACERVQTSLLASQECAVGLSRVRDRDTVAEQIIRACEKIFGTSRKAFVLTMLTETGDSLRPRCIGGSLVSKGLLNIDFPLGGSLAGFCLRRRKPVIIHDLPRAERRDSYFLVVKELKCAMGAPIVFNEKKFGVLTLGSDRQFEFTEEPDLHIVSDLASLAAAAFARLEAEQQAQDSLRASVRGVAHSLGNRIPTLKIWLGRLRRKAGKKFKEEIERLDQGIDFVSGAVGVAARFGRMAKPVSMEHFDLSAILQRLQGLYPDKRVSWHIRGRLPMTGNARLIEQAVVELLTNALRLVRKRKGKIQISAYRRKIESRIGTTHRAVIIRVEDNGPGVARNKKESIFQPFKTADPAAHFGLGLSFVQSVAQRHGGYVEEYGTEGQGASFRIVFPQ